LIFVLVGPQQGRGVIFDESKRGFLIIPLEAAELGSSTFGHTFAWNEMLALGRWSSFVGLGHKSAIKSAGRRRVCF
jgi:hypothetical protein